MNFYKNGTSQHIICHEFFRDIDTEIKAYLLGFLYADGCVSKDKYSITVHVTETDKYIIDLFKRFVSPDANVYKHNGNTFISRGNTYKSKPSLKITIGSSIIVKDLEHLGISENKTWKELHIPDIPKSLIRYFILGYFDGDGCFTAHISEPNIKNREKNPRIKMSWNICSKRDEILKDFKYFLEKELDITLNINYIKRDNMFRLATASKKACKKLFDYFYAESHFYYERKFNKFNYYVNTEVSQLIADHRNAQEVNVNESNNPPKSAEHSSTE